MYETLNFLIALVCGYSLGREFRKIREALNRLESSLLERSSSPAVVSTNTEVSRIRRREESSFIVEPKSPQLVEYEQAEELKRLNPGKYT